MFSIGPRSGVSALLTHLAWGRCLDVGTGEGYSFEILKTSGASVHGLETDAEWHLVAESELVTTITEDLLVGYDFAFVDHFPLEDRLRVGLLLVANDVEVLIDDAQLVGAHPLFHSHDDALHYAPEGCAL